MSQKMDKRHCVGCDSNFYNGNNPLGIKECWCLKDAKIVTRYRIGWNVPQNRKENFVEVKVPDCYRQTNGFGYYSGIPKHLMKSATVRGKV